MGDGMICEVINPSDPYTLATDDFVLAGVAVAILGSGKMGLSGPDGQRTPLLFGWDDWFAENGIDLKTYVPANRIRMAEVLESFLIGPPNHRADVEAMLAEIPAERRVAWLAERQDRHRTSLSDIGTAAYEWAAKLRRIESEQAK